MLYATILTEHGRVVSSPITAGSPQERQVRGYGRTCAAANAEVRAELRRIQESATRTPPSRR
jgi:hypothetical protein